MLSSFFAPLPSWRRLLLWRVRPWWQQAKRCPGGGPEKKPTTPTRFEIARRLQKAGLADGVKLCQQLLDVLLKPEKKE